MPKLKHIATGITLSLLAAGSVCVVVVHDTMDDRPLKMRPVLLRALEAKIEAYAADSDHLPETLAQLLESDERGWQGPYARERSLHDIGGADITYEVIDSHRFRILLPARIRDGVTVWPAMAGEFEVDERSSAAR